MPSLPRLRPGHPHHPEKRPRARLPSLPSPTASPGTRSLGKVRHPGPLGGPESWCVGLDPDTVCSNTSAGNLSWTPFGELPWWERKPWDSLETEEPSTMVTKSWECDSGIRNSSNYSVNRVFESRSWESIHLCNSYSDLHKDDAF